MPEVRPFARPDRDQLTALVNAHIAAVVPGWAVSTAALLAALERDPGQYVTDAWVDERCTLVAVERDRVVAAAHLRRYRDDQLVGECYRGVGEVAWLVCWPQHEAAGAQLAEASVARLEAWRVRRQYADGDLPTPATYGVPDAWPHVRRLLTCAGFRDTHASVEVQLAGSLDGFTPPGPAPLDGLVVERSVGIHAARFSSTSQSGSGEVVGFVEAVDDHTRGGTLSRLAGWADLAELHVSADLRGRGVGTWLLAHEAAWLRLGGTTRFLVALGGDDVRAEGFFARLGLQRINRTHRGWERATSPRSS